MMDHGEFYIRILMPDGQYQGRWGGYVIQFEHDGKPVVVRTELGVRGINIPVTFQIVDGLLDNKSITIQR